MTLERLRESPDGLVWPLYSLEDKERTGSVFAEGKLLTPSGKMKAVDTLFGRFPQWDYPKGRPRLHAGNGGHAVQVLLAGNLRS